MKKLNLLATLKAMIAVISIGTSVEGVACEVGNRSSCSDGVCSTRFTRTATQTMCKKITTVVTFPLSLPFQKGTPIYCFKGGQIANSTHSFDQTLFAMDLGSHYSGPPATVTAAESGYAVVVGGCKNAPGRVDANGPDTCNDGFGNQVRILHQNNLASQYAHLEKILVADGQYVKKGQAIGIEGYSGNAGARHVHFDVHYIPAQNMVSALAQLHQKSPTQESVPYQFEIMTARGKGYLGSYVTVCPEWGDFSVPPLYRTFLGHTLVSTIWSSSVG